MNKKIIGSVIVLCFIISGLHAVSQPDNESHESVTSNISFSQPLIKQVDQYVSVHLNEETSLTSEPTCPELPVVTKLYQFPIGTTIDQVSITYHNPTIEPLCADVQPALPAQYISSVYQVTDIRVQNKQIYESNSVYPQELYKVKIGAGIAGSEHVLFMAVHLYPVSYYPLDKQIKTFTDATIDIRYHLPEQYVQFPDEYDLLILSPSEFSSALQPLVNAKESKGIATNLVSLEDIPSVGLDKQEDIKYFIKDAIEQWGITNVLIVGSGIEGEEKFPVRYAYVASGNYERKFPSDLYYADVYNEDLSFSTWDNDSDGRYAEYDQDNEAVDLYPDVNLGRLPCSSVTDVENVVNKIITYMDTNKMNNKIVQMGGDTFPDDPGKINEGEYANEQVMQQLPTYSTTQIWGSKGNLWRFIIILQILKGVDFIDFSGHGSVISWATHPPQDESVWLPKGIGYNGFTYIEPEYYLINSWKLPVIVLNACSCNKFTDYDPCLGWSFVKRPDGGGIASFGASGIGYGSYGTSETERLFGWMEVHLFKELYQTKILGKVWTNCLNGYINSFDLEEADYKTIYEMAMFGDPSLAIDDAQ